MYVLFVAIFVARKKHTVFFVAYFKAWKKMYRLFVAIFVAKKKQRILFLATKIAWNRAYSFFHSPPAAPGMARSEATKPSRTTRWMASLRSQ